MASTSFLALLVLMLQTVQSSAQTQSSCINFPVATPAATTCYQGAVVGSSRVGNLTGASTASLAYLPASLLNQTSFTPPFYYYSATFACGAFTSPASNSTYLQLAASIGVTSANCPTGQNITYYSGANINSSPPGNTSWTNSYAWVFQYVYAQMGIISATSCFSTNCNTLPTVTTPTPSSTPTPCSTPTPSSTPTTPTSTPTTPTPSSSSSVCGRAKHLVIAGVAVAALAF